MSCNSAEIKKRRSTKLTAGKVDSEFTTMLLNIANLFGRFQVSPFDKGGLRGILKHAFPVFAVVINADKIVRVFQNIYVTNFFRFFDQTNAVLA